MRYYNRLVEQLIFPVIIVFNEKHGDDYFIATDRDDTLAAFNQKFNERKDWYLDEESLPETPEDTFIFMHRRGDYEYEGFSFETPSSLL